MPDVEYSTPLAEMQSISNKGVQPSVVEKSSADDVEKSTYRTGRMDLSVTLPYARADFVVEQSKNRQRLAVSGENRVVSDGVESVRFRLLTTNSRRNMAEHASVSWARSLAGTATTHTYAALDSASKNTDALNAGTQPAMGVAQPGLVAVNDGEAQAVVPQQISSPVLHLGGTGWPSVLAGQVARLTVGHSMVIRVHPERLGPIEVRATQGVGGLAIHLTVTHPQVEQILQQNIGMVASQIQVMQTTPSAPVSVSVQMNAALASGFGSMGGNPENHQGTPYTASAGQTFSSTDSMEIPTDAADAGNVVTTDVRFFESWV
ncbi:flagellar hook-length control protein FliK [Acidithiobacillus caldus]|uniref:flagellar hook-length control protein FliK n=1 Tax=Acidithiobacillus caldus TaxID=33059 RepID=UPI001300F01D|nr:flagellar hook-length control protein FliK [Acidithiobacillus caldus]MBU2746057.1 flagellar hook-length control protein FliK [Acidithiobacillus caldus]